MTPGFKFCTRRTHVGSEPIPVGNFVLQDGKPTGMCKDCHRERGRKARLKLTMSQALWMSARKSSRVRNLDFSITVEDVVVPKVCPILHIELVNDVGMIQSQRGRGNVFNYPNYPTIDRIDSSKGYIKGNVIVISWRANSLKKNSTPEEIGLLHKWFSGIDTGN